MPETSDAVRDTAFAVAAFLHGLDPGPLAEVRRMTGDLGAPAFWRLHARHREIRRRPDDWLRITRILGILTPKGAAEHRADKPLHSKRPLGAVLCDGGDPSWSDGRALLSEQRLARLLATRGAQRVEHLERAARMLACSMVPGSGVNTGDIARAVLNPASAHYIASSYYDRLDRATTSQS